METLLVDLKGLLSVVSMELLRDEKLVEKKAVWKVGVRVF
jgi:hypothetical protein